MSRLHSLRASVEDVASFLQAEPSGSIAIPSDVQPETCRFFISDGEA